MADFLERGKFLEKERSHCGYELTSKGEESLRELPSKMETRLQDREYRRDSTLSKWNKQLYLLDKVMQGKTPLGDSYSYLKEGPQKVRAQKAMDKELTYLVKVGLVKKADSSSTSSQLEENEPFRSSMAIFRTGDY